MSQETEPETVEKTDQEVQEALRRDEAPPEEPESEKESMVVDTAFVVFVQDGVGFGVAGLGDVEVDINGKVVRLELMKQADAGDMYRYSMEVAKDIQVSETATNTVRQMAMYTQQMQRAMEDQKLAQQVQSGGGPGGIHVPGR